MKIINLKPITIHTEGWLKKRFGDCYAAISTDVSLKLRSAVKDVARVRHNGKVPEYVELLTRKFENAPQGISDHDFVFGYQGSEGWVDGSILTDSALQDYIRTFPEEWEIVQKCLGLTRQKSKHACHPAGVTIFTIDPENKSLALMRIEECNGKTILTGQGNKAKATLLDQGTKEVWEFALENGKVLRCTSDHLLLTVEKGFRPAQEVWELGLELLISEDGTVSNLFKNLP